MEKKNHFQELYPSWNMLLALMQKTKSMEKLHNVYSLTLRVIFRSLPEALRKYNCTDNYNTSHHHVIVGSLKHSVGLKPAPVSISEKASPGHPK